jgi:transcriptional regulator with XRE-family HTH domain
MTVHHLDELIELDAEILASRRRLPPPPARRDLRERAGLTQAQVASMLQVGRSAVTRWELGTRNPRGELAARYGDLLVRLIVETFDIETKERR